MHIPVLLEEVIAYLNPGSNQNFIDCTVNGGGHSLEILKRTAPNGKILGIDFDPAVLERLSLKIKGTEFEDRLILICDNFANLESIAQERDFGSISGILFDLGISSEQLEQGGRGFSFKKDELLDMRFNPETNDLTADRIINRWPEEELVKIFSNYGEERFSKSIARKIVGERRAKPVKTTFQLATIIGQAIPGRYRHGRIHFATRVFQALRIAVNGELDNIERALAQTLEIIPSKARVAVISFHSLEDRIAKNFIRSRGQEGLVLNLTKKPIVPKEEEAEANPRSRSAKLRVFEKN